MGPQAAGYDAQAEADEAARLTQVRDRLNLAQAKDRRDEEEMHEDALMLVGGRNQWPEKALREREANNRPVYVGNRLLAPLAQITGEIRRNKPSISCKPGDGLADPKTAEIYEGLIRAIERLSQANRVYARVGKSAAAVGKGHMRIVPVYADDESFDVELRIRAIKSIRSVKWDTASQADDKSDANWCIVVSELDKKSFEEAYPTVGAAAWAKAQIAQYRKLDGWRSGDSNTVTVAEEWVVKREPYQRYRVAHTKPTYQGVQVLQPTGREMEIDGDVVAEGGAATIDGHPHEVFLEAMGQMGFEVVQTRTAFKKTICMYLWGGDKQIAGPIEWKGSRIPIFTVVGEEIDVDNETVTHGIIRHAKDDQRAYNYARSAELEIVGQSPKSPIIIADEQLDGHEDTWVLAQRQPVPYLTYNHVPGLPAPQERSGPQANNGPAQLAQNSITAMQDIMGIHDASLGKKSNETSGVAIEARDAQADTGTYVYLDNLNSTIESLGAELVAAIPHYYSPRKQIMILGADDAPAIISLEGVKLDLGKYHVICSRGPSYQTRRDKSADLVVQTMKIAPPPVVPVLFDALVDLTDMPNGDDLKKNIRAAMLAAGLLPPPQQMPGMPGPANGQPLPGDPNAPPSNVIQMPPRAPAPPSADPFAGIEPSFSPPRAPAARTRVGPLSAPPGM